MTETIPCYWKPTVACLFTHQPAWTFQRTDESGDMYPCMYCNRCFYYPTKKIKLPIYSKYFKR